MMDDGNLIVAVMDDGIRQWQKNIWYNTVVISTGKAMWQWKLEISEFNAQKTLVRIFLCVKKFQVLQGLGTTHKHFNQWKFRMGPCVMTQNWSSIEQWVSRSSAATLLNILVVFVQEQRKLTVHKC
jgi:hypothetical protein